MDRLTEAEIRHLCSTVTPAQREFCALHLNHDGWPEDWLQGANREPGQSLEAVEPFSVECWWQIFLGRVVANAVH